MKKGGGDLDIRGSGEDMGGTEGGGSVIRINKGH